MIAQHTFDRINKTMSHNKKLFKVYTRQHGIVYAIGSEAQLEMLWSDDKIVEYQISKVKVYTMPELEEIL